MLVYVFSDCTSYDFQASENSFFLVVNINLYGHNSKFPLLATVMCLRGGVNYYLVSLDIFYIFSTHATQCLYCLNYIYGFRYSFEDVSVCLKTFL